MDEHSQETQGKAPALPAQPAPGLPRYHPGVLDKDAEHLRILSICYYVMAGLSVISALAFAAYIAIGGVMMSGGMASGGHSSAHSVDEMRMMGGMFITIGVIGTLFVITGAVLEFLAAKALVRRKSKLLCYIVAGINCLSVPLGTVLGVFTFIVLARPSVADSFDRNRTP